MPNMNHKGPDGNGPKTGRKLGLCRKTEQELTETGTLGQGEGKKRHADSQCHDGKGKRLRYYLTQKKSEE